MFAEAMRSERNQNLLLLGLGAAFVFLRITHEPLWLDESYSALMTAHSLGDIWRYTQTDVHPPLYYIVLRVFTLVGGTSAFVYRLPSALCALGLILLGIGPIARLYSRRVGIIFSLLTITAPSIVSFAQEARMYAMMAFTVTGFVAYGLLAVTRGRKSDFTAFGIFFVAAMYTHYFALLAAAIFGCCILGYVHIRKSPYRISTWMCMAIAFIAYAPWLPSFYLQISRVAAGFWIPPADSFILKFAWMMPFAYKFEDIPWHPLGYVSMALALALIGYSQLRLILSRQERFIQLMPIILYLATFVMGIILSWTFEPILMPRDMLFGTPLFFLALAMGIASLPRPAVQIGITAVSVLLVMPADLIIYRHNFNGAFNEVATWIQNIPDPDAPIVHEDWQTLLPLARQLPNRTHLFLAPDSDDLTFDDFYGDNPPIVVHSIKEVFQYAPNAWFVDSNLMPLIGHDALYTDDVTPIVPFKEFERAYAFIQPTVIYGTLATIK